MAKVSFNLTGIDAVVYGVTNMEKGRTFFSDWGLARKSATKTRTVYRTDDGAEVVLKPRTAKDLPASIEGGPTVREMVWGVKSKKDLAGIRAELSKDREVTEDKDGTLHSADDMGLGIGFRITRRKKVKNAPLPMNSIATPGRVDKRATYYDRAHPTHIGHCVFAVPDLKRIQNFYIKRLGFRISDHYTGLGIFLRCAPRGGHHNLFFMQSAENKPALNHVAFGVRDIHEMFAGGLHISNKGWKTEIGPGRHHVSSCYFWYVKNPCGGAAEYFCDEDFLTESWKPGHWNPAPETFAEWVLSSGIQRATRKPPTRNEAKAS